MTYDEDIKAMYDEAINEAHEPVVIAGITFEPARVLEEMDPVAYRVGYVDFCNELDEE